MCATVIWEIFKVEKTHENFQQYNIYKENFGYSYMCDMPRCRHLKRVKDGLPGSNGP